MAPILTRYQTSPPGHRDGPPGSVLVSLTAPTPLLARVYRGRSWMLCMRKDASRCGGARSLSSPPGRPSSNVAVQLADADLRGPVSAGRVRPRSPTPPAGASDQVSVSFRCRWGRPLFNVLVTTRPASAVSSGSAFTARSQEDMVEYDYTTAHQQHLPRSLNFISGSARGGAACFLRAPGSACPHSTRIFTRFDLCEGWWRGVLRGRPCASRQPGTAPRSDDDLRRGAGQL